MRLDERTVHRLHLDRHAGQREQPRRRSLIIDARRGAARVGDVRAAGGNQGLSLVRGRHRSFPPLEERADLGESRVVGFERATDCAGQCLSRSVVRRRPEPSGAYDQIHVGDHLPDRLLDLIDTITHRRVAHHGGAAAYELGGEPRGVRIDGLPGDEFVADADNCGTHVSFSLSETPPGANRPSRIPFPLRPIWRRPRHRARQQLLGARAPRRGRSGNWLRRQVCVVRH